MSIRIPAMTPEIITTGSSDHSRNPRWNRLVALFLHGRLTILPVLQPVRTFCHCLGILLLLGFWLVDPAAGWTLEMGCPSSGMKVSGGTGRDREWVCSAVLEATSFFRLNGLDLADGTTVFLTKELPGKDGSHALGEYHVSSNRIVLLTYEEALRLSYLSPPPLGIPMSPDLWRSYVVHELAHAAVERAFAPGVEKLAASEYIAAVAQLSSLPEATRSRIFKHFQNLPGFEAAAEITALYYFLDPGKFAVKAFRHYSRPGNGVPFIKHLLREGLPHSR